MVNFFITLPSIVLKGKVIKKSATMTMPMTFQIFLTCSVLSSRRGTSCLLTERFLHLTVCRDFIHRVKYTRFINCRFHIPQSKVSVLPFRWRQPIHYDPGIAEPAPSPPTRILADQLTLSQPGGLGADYVHQLLLAPSGCRTFCHLYDLVSHIFHSIIPTS